MCMVTMFTQRISNSPVSVVWHCNHCILALFFSVNHQRPSSILLYVTAQLSNCLAMFVHYTYSLCICALCVCVCLCICVMCDNV